VDPILLFCRGLAFWLPPLILGAMLLLSRGAAHAAPLFLLALLLRWLFRQSKRVIPPTPLGVLSPGDARVMQVAKARDPYLGRECLRVTFRLGILGPYALRSPVEGRLIQSLRLEHLRGDLAVDGPARGTVTWIETDEGDRIGVIFHRLPGRMQPICLLNVGERVGQGQLCGCIPFGGRLELLLPLDSRVKVSVGDRVRGGMDLVGLLTHGVSG
jgi:phosphatidylserine decarboxylase